MQRPDGSIATMLGWILIAAGGLSVFLATNAESINGWWMGIIASNLGIGLGVLLVSLGYLVRAIWFLPARDVAATPSTFPDSDPAISCSWCQQSVRNPNRPCDAIDWASDPELKARVTNGKCRTALAEQHIL
jgi:hypothetical protein